MDFTSIFNGEALTLEQFTEKTKGMKLADLATGEYVSKGKYDADLKKERDNLKEARDTIATLETNKGDTEALQAELDKYKAAEEKRQQEAAQAAARAEMLDRFNRAKGENVCPASTRKAVCWMRFPRQSTTRRTKERETSRYSHP